MTKKITILVAISITLTLSGCTFFKSDSTLDDQGTVSFHYKGVSVYRTPSEYVKRDTKILLRDEGDNAVYIPPGSIVRTIDNVFGYPIYKGGYDLKTGKPYHLVLVEWQEPAHKNLPTQLWTKGWALRRCIEWDTTRTEMGDLSRVTNQSEIGQFCGAN